LATVFLNHLHAIWDWCFSVFEKELLCGFDFTLALKWKHDVTEYVQSFSTI
jgi:hypothetical protein